MVNCVFLQTFGQSHINSAVVFSEVYYLKWLMMRRTGLDPCQRMKKIKEQRSSCDL